MIPNTSLPSIQIGANKPNNPISPTKHARSVFDLTQSILTTINSDIVYPVFWEEVIPTDTYEIETVLGGRTATPLFPMMDNLWIQYDWWFVPHRLVWNHFENFFGQRELVESEITPGVYDNVQNTYLVPIIDDESKEYAAATSDIKTQGFGFAGLMSYLLAGNQVGVPMNSSYSNFVTSLLPRSFMKIAYDWYIDQNYGTVFINDQNQTERIGFMPLLNGDGPDDCSYFQLFKKGKKLDYFVRAQPNIMQIPNGNTNGFLTAYGAFVPLDFMNRTGADTIVTNNLGINVTTSVDPTTQRNLYADNTGDVKVNPATSADLHLRFGNETGLAIDLSNIGVAVNNIRLYEVLQRYYERSRRSGQRYVEYAYATYGAHPEDSRLQLSEWLGGHTERLQFSAVAQTSQTGDTALGELAAFGTLVSQAPKITKGFSEHGYVMCLASVFPDVTYQQGRTRKLARRTIHDFHDPLTENLTEQEVKSNEVIIHNDSLADRGTFGFVPRFSEMKEGMRKLSGLMRSNHPQSLDAWHYAQWLNSGTTESNNATFRTFDTDMARTQALANQPDLILYGEAKITAARPMQTNPIPIIGGGF